MPQFPDMSQQMAQSIAAARPGQGWQQPSRPSVVGGGGEMGSLGGKSTKVNASIDPMAFARLLGYKSYEERVKMNDDFVDQMERKTPEERSKAMNNPATQKLAEGMFKAGGFPSIVMISDNPKRFGYSPESTKARMARLKPTETEIATGAWDDEAMPGPGAPGNPMQPKNGMNNPPSPVIPPTGVQTPTSVQPPTAQPTPTQGPTPREKLMEFKKEIQPKSEADYLAEGGPEAERYIANTKLLTNAKVSDLDKQRAEAEIKSFESNVRMNERQKNLQALDQQIKLEQLKHLTDPYTIKLSRDKEEAEIAFVKAQTNHENASTVSLTGKLTPDQELAAKGSLDIYKKNMALVDTSWATKFGVGIPIKSKFDVLNQHAGVVHDLQNSLLPSQSEVAANPALGSYLGRVARTIDEAESTKQLGEKGVAEAVLRSVANAWDLTATVGEVATPVNENMLFDLVTKAFRIAPNNPEVIQMVNGSLDEIAKFRAKEQTKGVVVPAHPLEIAVQEAQNAPPPEPKQSLLQKGQGLLKTGGDWLKTADEFYREGR